LLLYVLLVSRGAVRSVRSRRRHQIGLGRSLRSSRRPALVRYVTWSVMPKTQP